jgi:hypothetical protein
LATTFVGHVIWGGGVSRHAFVATADGSPMFKTPSPIVSAKAVILSVPGASGPEYVNPHWPAKSVAHCPPVVVAPSTTNTTETLGTGARVGDEKSLTVADVTRADGVGFFRGSSDLGGVVSKGEPGSRQAI